MSGEVQITLFGPLRNRAPEHAANQFLRQIQHGECRSLLASKFASPVDLDNTCSEEAVDPIIDWHLHNRIDSAEGTQLLFLYSSRRVPSSKRESIEMTIKQENGQWVLLGYGRSG